MLRVSPDDTLFRCLQQPFLFRLDSGRLCEGKRPGNGIFRNQPEELPRSIPDVNSSLELLEKLGELHRSGVLKDDEFEAKKQRILQHI